MAAFVLQTKIMVEKVSRVEFNLCMFNLLLTNAQTPIFGEAYELRKQRVKLKMKLLGNQRKKISNS
jgi:hypothetical protein